MEGILTVEDVTIAPIRNAGRLDRSVARLSPRPYISFGTWSLLGVKPPDPRGHGQAGRRPAHCGHRIQPRRGDPGVLIDHGKACIRISCCLGQEPGQPCTMNIWTGDDFKDIPGDHLGLRERYRQSIDGILPDPCSSPSSSPTQS